MRPERRFLLPSTPPSIHPSFHPSIFAPNARRLLDHPPPLAALSRPIFRNAYDFIARSKDSPPSPSVVFLNFGFRGALGNQARPDLAGAGGTLRNFQDSPFLHGDIKSFSPGAPEGVRNVGAHPQPRTYNATVRSGAPNTDSPIRIHGVGKVRRRAISIPYRRLVWIIWEEEMGPHAKLTYFLNKRTRSNTWPQMHTAHPMAFRRLAACN